VKARVEGIDRVVTVLEDKTSEAIPIGSGGGVLQVEFFKIGQSIESKYRLRGTILRISFDDPAPA
jgi:hypothetical protein